jgi:hypothetical protein
MNLKSLRDQLLLQEDLNFLLTNRVPRMALTRLMGRFSRIRSPWLARASIAVWRLFTDLDLSDAKQQHFDSLHACFTRELVAGARPYRPTRKSWPALAMPSWVPWDRWKQARCCRPRAFRTRCKASWAALRWHSGTRSTATSRCA